MLLFLLIPFFSLDQKTDPAPDMMLYDEIAEMDKQVFEAVNNCDIENLKSYFSQDLEFFHDKGGLTNFDECIRSIQDMCASGRNVRRELVTGTMKVYPIPDYGAIQEASHHFYATEIGAEEKRTGTFKFVHIWKKEDDNWKLTRVVSYGH